MEYKDVIRVQIQKVLNHKFSNCYQKQQIIDVSDSIRFACPYCKDSTKNMEAKRGNYYFSIGFYHCFNCDRHLSGIKFMNYFNDNENFDVINHIKKLNIKKTIETLNIDFNTDELISLGIDKDYFFEKLGLEPLTNKNPFIQKRLMGHVASRFAQKGQYIYIFNIINNKIIGYQIRHATKKFYMKFPLTKIYEVHDFLETPPNINSMYNKVSLIYNLLNIDTSVAFTIFEGPIDCFSYMKNSIGVSSIAVNTDFLDDTGNARYMYDNDKDGKIKMINKLNKGCAIFLWKKFIKDNNITVQLNDMNDILKYFYMKKTPHKILELDKYFSKNKYNLIYV